MSDESVTKRAFLKNSVLGALAGLALPELGGRSEAAETASAQPMPAGDDPIVTMTADLRRALAKPVKERRWGMVIDTRKCIGCNACTVACIAENNLPQGVMYRTVPQVESGTYPDVERAFMPTNCMQCENPPCVPAANAVVKGSMKRRDDGIVEIDYKRMKGRKVFEAAKKACPYTALSFDEGRAYTAGTPAEQPYEKRTAREYGRSWTRNETTGSVRKCHFCTQRLEAGQLPACVTTCTGQAMNFGDLTDRESRVAALVSTGKARRLEAQQGTSPRVLYLGDFPADPPTPADLAISGMRRVQSCTSCHSFDEPKAR